MALIGGMKSGRFITADGRTLPVPAHRPIKPIYIKKFIAFVKRG